MSLFKVFPKSHIDEEILNLYLEIEVLISKIAEKFEDYLRYVFESEYYKRNPKDKKFYSIIRVYHFFKKIKEDFSDCFTIRENKKYFDFQKNSGTFAEKKEIETELKVLIRLLNRIHSYVLKLDKKNIKSNDFRELEKFIDEFKRREEFLKVIQKHDEERIKKLLHKIVKEAKENQKKGIWLLDQNNKRNKLLFSHNFSISELRILDLSVILPLHELKTGVRIRELHKDSTLPIYHYNIEINGENIHVVPRNLDEKLSKYLTAS